MIDSILQWHYDNGGNLQGFIVGIGAVAVMGWVMIVLLTKSHRKNKTLSDEDFLKIALDELEAEGNKFRKKLREQDHYE